MEPPGYEFVVKTGAVGGGVAIRLAEADLSVCLFEVDGDPRLLHGDSPNTPDMSCLPQRSDSSIFHGVPTES